MAYASCTLADYVTKRKLPQFNETARTVRLSMSLAANELKTDGHAGRILGLLAEIRDSLRREERRNASA